MVSGADILSSSSYWQDNTEQVWCGVDFEIRTENTESLITNVLVFYLTLTIDWYGDWYGDCSNSTQRDLAKVQQGFVGRGRFEDQLQCTSTYM